MFTWSVKEAVSFCDPAKRPVARAYQGAAKVLDAYYYDRRLRVGPAYLAAAEIVLQCFRVALFAGDLLQKKRELSAWTKGRLAELSPGTFYIVPEILSRWRELQLHGLPQGPRLDAVAQIFNRDRSTLKASADNAIARVQEIFGCYCNDLPIPVPPENHIRA